MLDKQPAALLGHEWRERGDSPNSSRAKLTRQDELRSAWYVDSRTRSEVVLAACRGRNVLDIGCVNHLPSAMDSAEWLHGRITGVAKRCVGTDIDREGVERIQGAGFDAVWSDICGDISALIPLGPFEVIIAGELIEHLGNPEALLRAAYTLLAPGGRLLVTTPNPYAMWRARNGQFRLVWENVDHVVYLFPSGIVELANRTGFVLRSATTVDHRSAVQVSIQAVRSLLVATVRRIFGISPLDRARVGGLGLPLPTTYLSPLEALIFVARKRGGQLGETSVYVLERPVEE